MNYRSGTQIYISWCRFDGASRMTQATLSLNGAVDHVLNYGFAGTGTACAAFPGAVGKAGANGNRTTFSDLANRTCVSTSVGPPSAIRGGWQNARHDNC